MNRDREVNESKYQWHVDKEKKIDPYILFPHKNYTLEKKKIQDNGPSPNNKDTKILAECAAHRNASG